MFFCVNIYSKNPKIKVCKFLQSGVKYNYANCVAITIVTKGVIVKKIIDAVNKHRQLILDAEKYVWNNPETGFKEFKTSAYMEEQFKKLGYGITKSEDITGFYVRLDTGKPGPELLVFAELDSVICPTHKDADKVTGAVHSCGHNAQCASILGVAAALKEQGVTNGLSGAIRICLVPAEELLEIEYRTELKKQGKIKYIGGKCEYLYRGFFDGVDLAFIVHTTVGKFGAPKGNAGCIVKKIVYKGVAAHAGGSPWKGKNALYAANCGLNAVNAIRETFKDGEQIRVHPIITHGGDMVNAIPSTVTLESYVRGTSFNAITETNKKVNQALIGAALSIGTNVEVIDMPGYAPLTNDEGLLKVAKETFTNLFPSDEYEETSRVSGVSTDMGDLCCLMPVMHPYAAGAKGVAHGSDYYIADPESACIKSATWQVAMIVDLLSNNAEKAREIVKNYKPLFNTKEDYLLYIDSLECSGDRIVYNDDGTAIVKI